MMIDMGSLAACREQEEQTVSQGYISSYLYFSPNTLLILQSQNQSPGTLLLRTETIMDKVK